MPPLWQRALLQMGIRTPWVKCVLAKMLARSDSGYGLQMAAERIALSDTDTWHQDFRNLLCELFRWKFRGARAVPALRVLREGYAEHSAARERSIREKQELPTNTWGIFVSMSGIRYAIADVLKDTDDLPTLSILAQDLCHEWNSPTAGKVLDAMGKHVQTHFQNDILPSLTSHNFDIRSLASNALSRTPDARVQCAMVHALQESCMLRMERVTAGLWDAATAMIRSQCIALLRTDLQPEAREQLREGYMDPSAAYFCDRILKFGCIDDPAVVVDQIMASDPDRNRKMMRMMAEAMAADEVRAMAKQNGLAIVDWEGPYGTYWSQLAHKLEQDMADAGGGVMP